MKTLVAFIIDLILVPAVVAVAGGVQHSTLRPSPRPILAR